MYKVAKNLNLFDQIQLPSIKSENKSKRQKFPSQEINLPKKSFMFSSNSVSFIKDLSQEEKFQSIGLIEKNCQKWFKDKKGHILIICSAFFKNKTYSSHVGIKHENLNIGHEKYLTIAEQKKLIKSQKSHNQNMVITRLSPKNFDLETLETLSRGYSPDILIITKKFLFPIGLSSSINRLRQEEPLNESLIRLKLFQKKLSIPLLWCP